MKKPVKQSRTKRVTTDPCRSQVDRTKAIAEILARSNIKKGTLEGN